MVKSKLPHIGTTIFSVMSALANETGAINLSQGFPNFPIDVRLKDLVKKALDDEQVQYAAMPGRQDLREQLAAKLFLQHEISVNSNEEITITAGATQAIFSIISAVISPGDEVIMFDPAYDCYDPAVILQGAKAVHINLTFPDFKIDWDKVESQINPNTKLIIVNNPTNPAGSVWDSSDIVQLEKICEKHPKLLVLSDEVYEHMQFKGQHQSVLASPFLRERSFAVYSFGKTFHVTGWKIGYCIAPSMLSAEMRKVHQFNVFCVNNTMQAALANYLSSGYEWKTVSITFQEKRDFFMDAMKRSRFKPLACDGTYFVLYDYSEISALPDTDFAIWLTKEHGVASIPTSVFYEDKTDNKVVRFCFAKDEITLSKAVEKLCKI